MPACDRRRYSYGGDFFADKLAESAEMLREHRTDETAIADMIARAEADFMQQRAGDRLDAPRRREGALSGVPVAIWLLLNL